MATLDESAGPKRSILRRLSTNVALLGTSAFVCLLLVELVLRMGLVANPRYDLLTSTGQTDDPIAKVTIVGDSYIYGGGKLDSLLVDKFESRGYALQNLARPGMNPVDYLAQLKQNAKRFKPDLILFCYYAGNDLSGVIHRSDGLSGKRGWIKKNIYNPMKRFYVVSWISKMRSISSTRKEAGKMTDDDSELATWGREHKINPFFIYASDRVKSSFVEENLIVDSEHSKSGIAKLAAILDNTKEIADDLGADLGIVIFPSPLQINRHHFPFFEMAGFVTYEETLINSGIQDHISQLSAERAIPVLDLLTTYRAEPDSIYHLEYNIHFNMLGNQIAAREMDVFGSELLAN